MHAAKSYVDRLALVFSIHSSISCHRTTRVCRKYFPDPCRLDRQVARLNGLIMIGHSTKPSRLDSAGGGGLGFVHGVHIEWSGKSEAAFMYPFMGKCCEQAVSRPFYWLSQRGRRSCAATAFAEKQLVQIAVES